jgi:large subunit ribosomal protein L6
MWGTARTQVANLVAGVTKGFEKKLEITGVGYRAAPAGQEPAARARLQPRRRLSDPGRHRDHGAEADRDRHHRQRFKQRVGQVAAEIRSYRPPEPYKGKGVKYADEFIFRKEGKKK